MLITKADWIKTESPGWQWDELPFSESQRFAVDITFRLTVDRDATDDHTTFTWFQLGDQSFYTEFESRQAKPTTAQQAATAVAEADALLQPVPDSGPPEPGDPDDSPVEAPLYARQKPVIYRDQEDDQPDTKPDIHLSNGRFVHGVTDEYHPFDEPPNHQQKDAIRRICDYLTFYADEHTNTDLQMALADLRSLAGNDDIAPTGNDHDNGLAMQRELLVAAALLSQAYEATCRARGLAPSDVLLDTITAYAREDTLDALRSVQNALSRELPKPPTIMKSAVRQAGGAE